MNWFMSLQDARDKIERWRRQYNQFRPHSVIMTFIFKKTNGSVLLMVLYHYTITMSGILSPSFSYDGQADDVLKTLVSVAVIAVGALAIALFSKTFRQDASFKLREPAGSAGEM